MRAKDNGMVVQDQSSSDDYEPLIALFELLLEWEMKDQQEKEETKS